jgi:hypothetical protein
MSRHNTPAQNRRTYLNRTKRQTEMIASIPQIPSNLEHAIANNYLTGEQEAEVSRLVYEAAEVARSQRRALEDRTKPVETAEYTIGLRNGCLVGRCV